MSTKEGQPATKQQINSSDIIVVDPAVIRDAVVLSEDILMLIFSFTDFVTLIRVVQRICMHWKMMVCRTLPFILGSKPFETRRELIGRIREYCGNKILYADKIARIYGWPIGKWNVSKIVNFELAFEDQANFNEDIGEWDMSNATNLVGMFSGAADFNQDVSRWNTLDVFRCNVLQRRFIEVEHLKGDKHAMYVLSCNLLQPRFVEVEYLKGDKHAMYVF
mmetsp:Transcript_29388/g.43372  ORF Transcript_29388/g.43372 Transcript_29388/m.43372 type:complete len:220 (-) Transcript_29388:31-690(-)